MCDLHDAEFKKTDCLKNVIVVKRQGHYLRMQILSVSKYLRQNHKFIEHIFKSMTEIMCCKASRTFLDNENACMIYDVRPKACREFPHTDRKVSTDH
jgi:hypothetical protein